MNRRALLAAVVAAAAASGGAGAQVSPAGAQVAIGGSVVQPVTYTVTALAAMPALQVQAPGQGGALATFIGTPLWPLIETAQPIDGPEPGARYQHVLVARGADGYAAVLAIGEISPLLEAKPVIIAYKQDGALLAAPRLIVPGDRHPTRSVRNLVAIEVR